MAPVLLMPDEDGACPSCVAKLWDVDFDSWVGELPPCGVEPAYGALSG
jgi:hypothetical protein